MRLENEHLQLQALKHQTGIYSFSLKFYKGIGLKNYCTCFPSYLNLAIFILFMC